MPQNKRRRKGGKYAPLVWIITAAVIAFFIGYSNTFKNLPFSQKNPQTNTQNNSFNLTNLFPVQPQSQGSASMSLSSVSNEAGSSSSQMSTNEQYVKVKIYLAKRGDKELSLVEKTVLMPRTQSMLKD